MTYIGCMKKGPVITDPKMKWLLSFLASFFFSFCFNKFYREVTEHFSEAFLHLYNRYESSGQLIGNEYFLHAYGPIYALSADVVAALAIARNDRLVIYLYAYYCSGHILITRLEVSNYKCNHVFSYSVSSRIPIHFTRKCVSKLHSTRKFLNQKDIIRFSLDVYLYLFYVLIDGKSYDAFSTAHSFLCWKSPFSLIATCASFL